MILTVVTQNLSVFSHDCFKALIYTTTVRATGGGGYWMECMGSTVHSQAVCMWRESWMNEVYVIY